MSKEEKRKSKYLWIIIEDKSNEMSLSIFDITIKSS